MKSGPRIGTSVLSSSRADIAPHHLGLRASGAGTSTRPTVRRRPMVKLIRFPAAR
jgi:hypothetical protein